MKVAKLLFLFVCISLVATPVHAKDLKIAYVELGGVFNNYNKTKDYDAKLQKETQDAQKQMEEMLKKYRDAEGKLALLKEDEKAKLQASIDKQKMDLMEFQKQKRSELGKNFEDKRKEILLEIEKVASDIAKKDGYDFIFNETVIIYAEAESNMTEKVLKALNDSYSAKK